MFNLWHLIAAFAAGVVVMVWYDWTRRVENTAEHHARCINDIDRRITKLERAQGAAPAAGSDPWDEGPCTCPLCGGEE